MEQANRQEILEGATSPDQSDMPKYTMWSLLTSAATILLPVLWLVYTDDGRLKNGRQTKSDGISLVDWKSASLIKHTKKILMWSGS